MRTHHPLRTLTLLIGGALIMVIALVGSAARGDAPKAGWFRFMAPADTDSVALTIARADTDSVLVDLARADTDSVLVDLARADTDSVLVDLARADTDSIALGPLGGLLRLDSLKTFIDSLGADSLRALIDAFGPDSVLMALVDSIAPIDTNYRAQRYFSGIRRDQRTASLFPREPRPFSARMGNNWKHNLELDSTGQYYIARERVGDDDVRYPLKLTLEQYQQQKLEASLDRNWRELITKSVQLRRQQRRGVGLNITVPGGRQSAFTSIFGKNEVDLRVTGNADIRTGFDYRKSDQQVTLGQGAQIDPDFKQNLRLGVTGTIGDKMRVDVNWDTERDFDYQNQLKLQYTGYEDEILQSVEAGNVFLQTPSTLIRGGQSLFGIKTEFKVGGFHLTTVASQQEGQSSNLSLEGGAETTSFNLKPTDYDERTHFYLGYYFRNRWEPSLSDPPTILIESAFSGITDVEIWKLTPVSPEEQNVRQVVALIDLGEPPNLVTDADAYTDATRPNSDIDQYSDGEIAQNLRPGNAVPKDFLESAAMEQRLSASDYQVGQFKKLIRGRDYEIDELLGFITLKQRMQESEALAVAFRYLSNGSSFQVGDFSSETGGGDNSQTGDRLVLKLLKPVNLQQPANLGGANALNPAAWYLEMRNVYRLGRGLKANEFALEIGYEPPGKSTTKTLPGVSGQRTLIQVLGLDRLNEDGAAKPDNLFDYLPNYTINPGEGLLIFPYLEPFGQRIEQLIGESNLSAPEQVTAREQFVFGDLYTQKKINAQRNTQLDVYRILGSYKGGIPSFYDLRAFSGLIEGSVRVTSGGVALSEGSDFIVDYQGGTVTIINPSYLTAGRDIAIDYEQNALINLQKKTLLGARLDYSTSERLVLGTTIMRMSQKSLTDKFRIGEEPIANTIWGFDGQLDLQPRWLTRAIDALPFLQTKEPSAILISGEFAQLRPGHTQTNAFKDERRDLRKEGLDFNDDEIAGVSYVDDFESFENLFSLNRPGAWLLGSAPILNDSMEAVPRELSNNKRGLLGWYQLNSTTLDQLGANPQDKAAGLVTPQEVFPNRQTSSQERILTTLDFYFTPHQRGPYNYNTNLGGDFLDNPRTAWGGMTQRLTEGNTDFTSKNIEFVEFVFKPIVDGGGDAGAAAKLYVDLGLISEDVIPDNKLNTEDGLSLTEGGPVGAQARLSTGQQDQVINPINPDDRITEDLGLDGLASFPNNKFANEGGLGTEEQKFADFLASLNSTTSARFPDQLEREKAKARRDPSGDDYHYFLDPSYFENGQFFAGSAASVQERFTHFFTGLELNSFEAQTELSDAATARGNSRIPDTEDINLNSTLDTENSYFQYELPLSLDSLKARAVAERANDYVVGEIKFNDELNTGTGWYLVRIPVKDFTGQVGNIQDFSLIESIRMWTTGHERPITLRFATLEFVGSQWRKSQTVSSQDVTGEPFLPSENPLDKDAARISIESVNNEENSFYAIPNGTVRSRIREATSGRQLDAREQAMVLRVENLKEDQQQAIFQAYNTAEDLLKYNNLRMFIHLDGFLNGRPLRPEDRDKVKFFMRLGANETNDYYEYEQSLTASSIDPEILAAFGNETMLADHLWQTNQSDSSGQGTLDLNSMNIDLGTLNQLKFLRDEYRDPKDGMPFPTNEVFWNDERGVLRETVARFAPPGTRLAIKGTPSLAKVNTLVIGVRNAADDGSILTDINVWVNELRVSGYDEDTGSAALLNADIQLADLARVKANIRQQTDGFGALASSLGERDQVNILDWAVNTQFNMDKFIPERYGWSIPLTMEVKSSTTTPRFDPNRGDVEVNDLLDAIAIDSTLTQAVIDARQTEIREQAQTRTETRSFTSRLQKVGSRSRLIRNTIDGLSFTYSFTDSKGRTPSQVLQDSWRWSSTLGYRLAIRKPRVFRPFGFVGNIPVLKVLGTLRFNYLPSSLNFTASANRSFTESKQRPDPVARRDETIPIDIAFPLRQQHKFTHARQFGLQYNPFGFLNLTFDTNTDQSLNALGVRTIITTIPGNTPLTPAQIRQGRFDDRINAQFLPRQRRFDVFEQETLETLPFGRVFNLALNGGGDTGLSVRTERYESRFNATFRPRVEKVKAFDWINIQDIGYGVAFSWRNGSEGNNTGAQVGTSVDLRAGATIRPQELFEKFGIYRKLQDQQTASENAAQARRDEKAKNRQARREQKRAEKEQRRQEKAAEKAARKAAEEAGEVLPEDEPQQEVSPEDVTPADEPQQDPPEEETPAEEAPADEAPQAADDQPPPAEGAEAAEADSTKKRGFRIPFLPNPVSLMRRAFLGVTGVRDLSLTYTGNRRTDATNVGRLDGDEVLVNYSLRDALFRRRGPSLRYRLGLERTIEADERILNERLQVSDALSNSDRWQGRTTLNPSRSLRINLTWSLETTKSENLTFRFDEVSGKPIADTTRAGDNRASVWAFGASYLDLFNSQLAQFRADCGPDCAGEGGVPSGTISSSVLTNEDVFKDFLASYLSGPGGTLGSGRLPFPLPGWQINYTGVSNWPIIRALTQSATLRHNYGADYSTDFRSNLISDELGTFTLQNGATIEYTIPDVEINAVRINERYQPLIALDLTFKGNIQTSIGWNKSNTYSLSTTNNVVSETRTSELTFTASYQQQGLKLPFIKSRLNNRINFSLTVSRSINDDRTFSIRRAIEAAAVDPTFDPALVLQDPFANVLTKTSRLQATPKIAYQFSNRVSADVFVKYENFVGDSRRPSTTSINGGFNIRVSIAN